MNRRPALPRWEVVAGAAIAIGLAGALLTIEFRRADYRQSERLRAIGYLDTLATSITTELTAWQRGMLDDGRWTATLIASIGPNASPAAARALVLGQMPTARLWLVDEAGRVIGEGADEMSAAHHDLVRASRTADAAVLGASGILGAQLRLAVVSPVRTPGRPRFAVLDLAGGGRLARRIPRLEWQGNPGRVALAFSLGTGFVRTDWRGGVGPDSVTSQPVRASIPNEGDVVVRGSLADSTPSFDLVLPGAAILAQADARVRRERMAALVAALGLWLAVAVLGWISRNRQLEASVRQAADLRVRTAEAERAAARAGLAALQARMHPHFLSNALHSLAGLIGHAPKTAEEAIDRLGDLFRYALEQSEQATVSLEEEWRFATDYLAIETLRLGDRLRLDLHWDPAVRDVPVPPFTLQVLVENAVRHGIGPGRQGGTIRLSARRVDGGAEVEVADDGVGAVADQVEHGSGTGLRTVRERLALDPDGAGALAIETSPGAGFRARIVVRDGAFLAAGGR